MIAARAAHVRCDAASGRCEAEACGGFYLLRSKDARYGAHDGPHYGARDGAARASAFLEAMFARMAWQREHVDERLGEQPALNYALRRTAGLRYALLERALYPNGNAFFVRRVWPARGTGDVVLVHNNWIAGDAPKVQLP